MLIIITSQNGILSIPFYQRAMSKKLDTAKSFMFTECAYFAAATEMAPHCDCCRIVNCSRHSNHSLQTAKISKVNIHLFVKFALWFLSLDWAH